MIIGDDDAASHSCSSQESQFRRACYLSPLPLRPSFVRLVTKGRNRKRRAALPCTRRCTEVREEYRADQANLRLIVATCAILYVVLIGLLPGLKVETYLPIVAYYGLFLIAPILLRQAIVRWPGHYPARRIFCMLHDYAGTSFGLIVGGRAALPLYAVMVWINLGNGMRYGSRATWPSPLP